MSCGSKPSRPAISSLVGCVPSAKASEVVAGLAAAPPILADLAQQPLSQLGGANPGPEVVGGIEACVHVREIRIGAVGDSGRRREQAVVLVRAGAAAVAETAPELQLETQLAA